MIPKKFCMNFHKAIIWLATLVLFLFLEQVYAQTVPSAVAILPQASQKQETEEATEEIESSRYQKRITTQRRAPPLPEKKSVPVAPQAVEPDPVISRPMEQASSLMYGTPAPGPLREQTEQKPTVGEEVRDLVIGGSSDHVSQYESFLAPEDIRRNRVELEVAPLFIYNESKSEHWVRSYNAASPAGRVGLNVWFTPFFGVASNYTKTFQSTVQKQFNSTSQTKVTDQWLQLGFRFRRFSSRSTTAPGMTIGVDYYDYQRKLPIDDIHRNGLQTTGLLLSAESRLPASENFAWILKIDYMPIANHRETSLGSEKRSGGKAETFNAGLSVGPEFKLNRTNRLFVRGRVLYEKNSFNEQSNTPDPQTGTTPENVSVTNTFLFFEVGYIWGN